MEIRCTKAGFTEAQTVADAGFEPWTLGNILIGGLIGLIIDLSTGSINKYPSDIQVPMVPSTGAPNPTDVGPAASDTASSGPPTS